MDTYYIHEVDIPSLSLSQPLIESPSRILYYKFIQNGIVVRRVGVLESIVEKYDFQGNLLFEKVFSYYSIINKITANSTLDQLAAYCKDTLWILNSDLEKQSFETVKNIQALGSGGNISQDVQEFQENSQGGYLAVGSTAPWTVPDDQHLSFILVLNPDGTKDWGIAYSQFYMPLTTIPEIETNDGYVVVGGHSVRKDYGWSN
ncbi:MAG: hypothetical protein IPJ40_16480 [Saprospirales bacterium]|nr:hypothetical protein [Saprospirales bacterium]